MSLSISSIPNQIVQSSNIRQKISTLRMTPILALALAILGIGVAICFYINKLKNKLNERDIQVRDLTNNLNTARNEKTDVQGQLTAAKNEKAEIQTQLTAAKNEKAEIQVQLTAVAQEKTNLQTELNALKAIYDKSIACFRDLESALIETQKQNIIFGETLESLKQENTKLKAKQEVREQQLAPIEMRELSQVSDYLPADDSLPLEEKENLEQSINHQIGQGKVKQVWIKKNKDTGIVYYTTATSAAEKELKEEVKTAQIILDRLRKKHPEGSEFYLAIDSKESERPIRDEHGTALYTVQCARADKDLEKHLKAPISFNIRLQMCLQVLKGLSYLQEAGFVQGDLKPENILVFKNDIIRISDFGKAVPVTAESALVMRGNPRFCSPELETSQKGEVFSAALVMIRILEEALLAKSTSLINIEKPKASASAQRRGVEKYLVEHPDTSQVDQWKSAQGLKLAAACYTPSYFSLSKIASENAIFAYIDCLAKELEQNNLMKNTAELKELLRQMTCNDKTKRISMHEARDKFAALLSV